MYLQGYCPAPFDLLIAYQLLSLRLPCMIPGSVDTADKATGTDDKKVSSHSIRRTESEILNARRSCSQLKEATSQTPLSQKVHQSSSDWYRVSGQCGLPANHSREELIRPPQNCEVVLIQCSPSNARIECETPIYYCRGRLISQVAWKEILLLTCSFAFRGCFESLPT